MPVVRAKEDFRFTAGLVLQQRLNHGDHVDIAVKMFGFYERTLFVNVPSILIVVGGGGLRQAAKSHPQASKVYLDFLHYRRYYPARHRFPNPMPYADTHDRGQRLAG